VIIVALWLARARFGADRPEADAASRSQPPERYDTTLGEFHDMREALRPLEHTRSASRRVPQGRASGGQG
jgi:hypothetical protein